MTAQPGLRARATLRAEDAAISVEVDGVADRRRAATRRGLCTPSATPAPTATSRCPRASSRTTRWSAGRTARAFALRTGKPTDLPAYEPVPSSPSRSRRRRLLVDADARLTIEA